MQTRKLSARIASSFLVIHGLIEFAGLVFINSIPFGLISFGGLTGAALERNASSIAMYGVFWGVARLAAAWGSWSGRKWAVLLGIILSVTTIIAAVTIIPAGVTDTLFSIPVLFLLLFTWFGDEKIDSKLGQINESEPGV